MKRGMKIHIPMKYVVFLPHFSAIILKGIVQMTLEMVNSAAIKGKSFLIPTEYFIYRTIFDCKI